MKLNMKHGFIRLLLVVSYLIGIIMCLMDDTHDDPLELILAYIGILPVVIFIAGCVLGALFLWIKSGFLKGVKDE